MHRHNYILEDCSRVEREIIGQCVDKEGWGARAYGRIDFSIAAQYIADDVLRRVMVEGNDPDVVDAVRRRPGRNKPDRATESGLNTDRLEAVGASEQGNGEHH